jgi:hypothetical protein
MITKTKPTDLIFPMSLRQARITIRQLSQLPVIDFASLDPVKRKAEEARRKALLEQAAAVGERSKG